MMRQKLELGAALSLLVGGKELLSHCSTFIYTLRRMMSISALLPSLDCLEACFSGLKQFLPVASPVAVCSWEGPAPAMQQPCTWGQFPASMAPDTED